MGNSNKPQRGSVLSSTVRSNSTTSNTFALPFKSSFNQPLAPVVVCDNDDLECPICFRNFTALNKTICCNQFICTGCYKEIISKNSISKSMSCPYCSRNSLTVCYDSLSCKETQSTQINCINTNNKMSKPIPIATVDDRKGIEEQILKNQRTFQEDRSFSVSTLSRSFESHRSPLRQQFDRFRGNNNANANEGPVQSSPPRANMSLSDRLERLLLFYNGQSDQHEEMDLYDDEDDEMTMSDIGGGTRYSNSTNSRLRSTSSVSSRSRVSSNDTNNNPYNHTLEVMPTLDELEEIMLLEAIRLSLSDAEDSKETDQQTDSSIQSTNISTLTSSSTSLNNSDAPYKLPHDSDS